MKTIEVTHATKPSLKFHVTVGILLRGTIKRRIIEGILGHGLQYEVHEEKGLLESMYIFTVNGSQKMLKAFYHNLNEYLEKMNSE